MRIKWLRFSWLLDSAAESDVDSSGVAKGTTFRDTHDLTLQEFTKP